MEVTSITFILISLARTQSHGQGTLGNVVLLCLGRNTDIDEPLASLYQMCITSIHFLENPMDLVPLLFQLMYEHPEVQRGSLAYWGEEGEVRIQE